MSVVLKTFKLHSARGTSTLNKNIEDLGGINIVIIEINK